MKTDEKDPKRYRIDEHISEMVISSPDFEDQGEIPEIHRYDYGENKPPLLKIDNIPENAKSLAVIMEDLDNPGPNLIHWVLWNIDPTINLIDGSNLPENVVMGKNDFTLKNYHGPCPLQGRHYYSITVFALDDTLDISEDIEFLEIVEKVNEHLLGSGKLVGYCDTPDEYAIE